MVMRIIDMWNCYPLKYYTKEQIMQNQQDYNPNYNPHQNYNNGGQQSNVQKVMNATIVTGEYFSQKENKNKKSYLTIGKLFIYNDGGMSLKLDALPSNGQSINFYDIKPKNQNNQQPQQNQQHQNYNPPQQQNNNYRQDGGYQGQ